MHPAFANAVGDDGKPWPMQATRHVTMVRRIGDAVVDIVQLLKDLGIDKNTLIVFTSDNGTHYEDHHRPDYLDTFGPYDGGKRGMWEGGIRMPTLVRWPSVIAAGRKSDSPSQFHDWMATFSDLAGMQPPALCDGVSIAPTLTSRGEQRLGIIYSEFVTGGKTSNYIEFEASRRGRQRGQMQSIVLGDYKGVRINIENVHTPFEVYHTLNDIKETTDLAGKPGVPTQEKFETAILRVRRSDESAKRCYDDIAVPALKGIKTRPGYLVRKTYQGTFPWVPQFDGLTVSQQDVVKGLIPAPGAQQFTGFLNVPVDGVYDFALTTKGKAIVRLHDALLINADTNYTAGTSALSGKIPLKAGIHPITINYLPDALDASLSLQWQIPGGKMDGISPRHFLCNKGE